jgi:hypothetical protein
MIALERTAAALVEGFPPLVYLILVLVPIALLVWIAAHRTDTDMPAALTVAATIVFSFLVLPSTGTPYLYYPTLLTVCMLFLLPTSKTRIRSLLSLGILIAGIPVGLEETRAVLHRIGLPLAGEGILRMIFTATPPAVVGLLLIAAGYSLLVLDQTDSVSFDQPIVGSNNSQ